MIVLVNSRRVVVNSCGVLSLVFVVMSRWLRLEFEFDSLLNMVLIMVIVVVIFVLVNVDGSVDGVLRKCSCC